MNPRVWGRLHGGKRHVTMALVRLALALSAVLLPPSLAMPSDIATIPWLVGLQGVNTQTVDLKAQGGPIAPETIDEADALWTLPRRLGGSPVFAFASGITSFFGIWLTLYGTQVRPVPYSLHRSLVQRKALIIASGVGLVFAWLVLGYGELDRLLLPSDSEETPAQLWVSGLAVFALVAFYGFRYDPLAKATTLVVETKASIDAAEKEALAKIEESLGTAAGADDLQDLAEAHAYYREMRYRVLDLILGQGTSPIQSSMRPVWSSLPRDHIGAKTTVSADSEQSRRPLSPPTHTFAMHEADRHRLDAFVRELGLLREVLARRPEARGDAATALSKAGTQFVQAIDSLGTRLVQALAPTGRNEDASPTPSKAPGPAVEDR